MSVSSPPPDGGAAQSELWQGARPRRFRFRLPVGSRRLKLTAFLVGFLLVMGIWLMYLSWSMPPTRLIILRSGPYEWPFPPNAWSAEDMNVWVAKDSDGTPVLRDTVDAQVVIAGKRVDVLENLTLKDPDKVKVIILYVNMHGIVHGEGGKRTPYLIPSDAKQDAPNTWLTIDELLAKLTETLPNPDVHKLVVLDCNRLPVNWPLELLDNDFPAALQTWWKEKKSNGQFEDVAILTSSSPGQQALASSDLERSVFGHYFSSGLAGEANARPNIWRMILASLGFPHRVTLRELEEYLKNNVDSWARNHGGGQMPLLLAGDNIDFDLVKVAGQLPPAVDTPSAVSPAEVKPLWDALDRLRPAALYRFEPGAWHTLEQDLLWLEQLVEAGSAYNELAQTRYDDLSLRLPEMEKKLVDARNTPSLSSFSGIVSDDPDEFPSNLKLHSLPLAEYFGSPSVNAATSARDELNKFQAAPSQRQLARAIRGLERLGLSDYVDRWFLLMLQRYQFQEMWQESPLLSQLMQIRERSERLGTPHGNNGAIGDERTHAWVRAILSEADNARRAAEDQLFVQGHSVTSLQQQLTAAEGAHHLAEQASEVMHEAMRLRDRAWAELPYYARWITDPAQASRPDMERSGLIGTVSGATDETRALEQLISNQAVLQEPAAALATRIGETRERSESLSKKLDELRVGISDECRALAEASDAAFVGRIEAALAVPLLSVRQRSELNKRLDKITKSPAPSTKAPAEPSKSIAAERRNLHARLVGEGPTDSESLDKLDQRLRPVAAFRRPTAASSNLDQIAENLRIADLESLLLWHAERALRDFWGPAGQSQSFFKLAAADYIHSAKQLAAQAKEAAPAVADLEQRLAQSEAATRNWLRTNSPSDVLLEPGDDAQARVTVEIGQPSDARPGGTAALLLRYDGQRLDGAQFKTMGGVELPGLPGGIDARVPSTSVPPVPADIDATMMFRGHEFPGSFRIEPLGGLVIETVPHEYEPGRVVLHSPWKQLSVVLVLDCSQSMNQELEADKSRLTVAKEALQQLMARLGSQRNVRLGVRLFGHRVGWSTDRPVRRLPSLTYTGEIPAELTPERDVEQLLPLGQFNFQSAQQVFSALDSVKQGWGQSPLYYSVEQALREDFAAEGPATDRHIVVITDGRDYQARPGGEGTASSSTVLQAWRERRVPIHILSLGADVEEERAAADEFTRLAEQTGGIFRNLTGALDLQTTLDAIVTPDLYRLERRDGSLAAEGELGMPLKDGSQRRADWYTTRYENLAERIWLEGGEEIDLYFHPGGTAFYAFPYDHDVAAEALIGTTGARLAGPHAFRVHRPLRDEKNVHFSLSLQRLAAGLNNTAPDAWRWTPRPREIWLEVTPLASTGEPVGQSYIFYDANWEPEKPVPVLRFVAQRWPSGSPRAAVRAWFKFQTTAPQAVVPLTDIVSTDGSMQRSERQVAPNVGITITAGRGPDGSSSYPVRIVERHAGSTPDIGELKILPPRGDSVRAARIVRQFDALHGIVVHTFYYDSSDANLIARLKESEFDIVTRQAAQSGAMQAEPLVIEISEAGQLLPLTGGWVAGE
jgi:hypothetical protein